MPQRVWMNVHFHTDKDLFVPPIRRYEHRIGVYPEAKADVLRAWYASQPDPSSRAEAARLTRVVSDFWLARAEARAADRRYLAAIGAVREAHRVDLAPAIREKLIDLERVQMDLLTSLSDAQWLTEERRIPEAIRHYERVLAGHPKNAVAHGRLGTLLALTGRAEGAVEHLREVARCDPNDPYGEGMLGWLAYLAGRQGEAVEAFERVEEVEPFNAENRYHWGLALLSLGRVDDAAGRFQSALAADPGHAGAHHGLSHALRAQGKLEEAVRHARRAVRLTGSSDAETLVGLGDAYTGVGRAADAVIAYQKALDVAAPTEATPIADKLAAARARAGQSSR
jgi:tetratricopeptide (TPR) repeat protein